MSSDLFGIARTLVRLAEEKQKPNPERLREYADSNLDSLYLDLFSPKPIYDDLEIDRLASGFSYMMEMFGGEDALVQKEIPYEVGRSSYRINPRGQILGDTDGFVKLLFDPDDQRILGASIVGEGACELIHLVAAVMSFGGTLDYFIQSVFNYPALSDAYKYAAYDGLQALARRRAKIAGLQSPHVSGAVKT